MFPQKSANSPLAYAGSLVASGLLIATLGACSGTNASSASPAQSESTSSSEVSTTTADEQSAELNTSTSEDSTTTADELRAELNVTEGYRDDFVHGDKPAECQKYIVLHDTEEEASAPGIIEMWEENGVGVAAHFIVDRDGSITQCVPMDKITHHAGFGDTGHNAKFGVEDESRDDKAGTTSIGDDYADYGMNSYSIGIEMSHVGGKEEYPEVQLEAVDKLIAYIDAYYGFESEIIDHKMWRTTNSDTSAEFATYLANYQATRTHDA